MLTDGDRQEIRLNALIEWAKELARWQRRIFTLLLWIAALLLAILGAIVWK